MRMWKVLVVGLLGLVDPSAPSSSDAGSMPRIDCEGLKYLSEAVSRELDQYLSQRTEEDQLLTVYAPAFWETTNREAWSSIVRGRIHQLGSIVRFDIGQVDIQYGQDGTLDSIITTVEVFGTEQHGLEALQWNPTEPPQVRKHVVLPILPSRARGSD